MKPKSYTEITAQLRYLYTGCRRCKFDETGLRLIAAARFFWIGITNGLVVTALAGATQIVRSWFYLNIVCTQELLVRSVGCLVFIVSLAWKSRGVASSVRCPAKPALHRIVVFADFLPLRTRRAVKAMAGDYDDEIRRLRTDKRFFAARWNIVLAWITAIWIAFRSPIVALGLMLVKRFHSS